MCQAVVTQVIAQVLQRLQHLQHLTVLIVSMEAEQSLVVMAVRNHIALLLSVVQIFMELV
jgi:hypothetical protein